MIQAAVHGAAPLTAEFHADARIVRADPVFHDLHAEAGGQEGEAIAVPQLANLVRIAAKIGTPISRPVLIGRDLVDLDLWVHLYPINGDNIKLVVAEWSERPRKLLNRTLAKDAVTVLAARGWEWQIDGSLHFSECADPDGFAAHALPEAGIALDDFFQLVERDSEPRMPMLSALVARTGFEGQRARLRSDPSVVYSLCAVPLLDALGRLTGYRGRAMRIAEAQSSASIADRKDARDAGDATARAVFPPDFARRLDHALRLPLGRIIANADTISGQIEGPLRQDYADYAADIASAGRHLVELVEDLADLEAIERPGFAAAEEEVDLCDLGRRAAGLLAVKATDRGIRIDSPGTDERVPARAEYRRVLQILVNLVGNAVRYSPEDSKIWLRAELDDRWANIVVADQGRGIDPADHERVFDRFERLGREDTAGSGLGLYISRKLARAMHGDILIDSALGQGARMTLRLPRWTVDTNFV